MSPGYLVVNVALFAVYNSYYYTCELFFTAPCRNICTWMSYSTGT